MRLLWEWETEGSTPISSMLWLLFTNYWRPLLYSQVQAHWHVWARNVFLSTESLTVIVVVVVKVVVVVVPLPLLLLLLLIIIIMIKTLKGAIWDCLNNVFTAPRTVSNKYILVQVRQGTAVCKSHATHQTLNTCNTPHAMWQEGPVQLLSLTELISHLSHLYFIGWNHEPMKEGRKLKCQGKKPWWPASANATSYSPKIQAPTKTRTCTVALMACAC